MSDKRPAEVTAANWAGLSIVHQVRWVSNYVWPLATASEAKGLDPPRVCVERLRAAHGDNLLIGDPLNPATGVPDADFLPDNVGVYVVGPSLADG